MNKNPIPFEIASALIVVAWNRAMGETARTSRISSVAYAVDESASEEKTASAVFLVSLSCDACSVLNALPTSNRLIAVAIFYLYPVSRDSVRRG